MLFLDDLLIASVVAFFGDELGRLPPLSVFSLLLTGGNAGSQMASIVILALVEAAGSG